MPQGLIIRQLMAVRCLHFWFKKIQVQVVLMQVSPPLHTIAIFDFREWVLVLGK